MKRVKNKLLPRSLVKNLSDDIGLFMASEPFGWLQALELFEQVPYEMREALLEELSACHSQAVLDFLSLLKMEHGRELEEITNRLMRKCAMSGLTPRPPAEPLPFYGAFACCSRPSGQLCLDVAWWLGNGMVRVDSILLSFHGDGLCSVLPMEQSAFRFTHDRMALRDMIAVSLEEACSLVQDSYRCNQRFVSRPALGRFLYQKYLDHPDELSPAERRRLLRRLSGALTPRQLVNSLFHAIRYQDDSYIDAMMTRDCSWEHCPNLQSEQHAEGLITLLEGKVETVRGTSRRMNVVACTLSLRGDQLCRCRYGFTLAHEDGWWLISRVAETEHEYLDEEHGDNPLNAMMRCHVYTIFDIDGLFELLGDIENVREMEELPYGVHMRIEESQEDFSVGVEFMSGVVADLVINAEELVIITQDAAVGEGIKQFLLIHCAAIMQLCGEYDVNLSAVYEYLSGRYLSFEELFSAEEEQPLFEDGLCLVSTRYFVRDREAVMRRLREMGCVRILEQDSYEVYHQLEQREGQNAMLAEYVLWPAWMTLSAFGDQDLQKIRGIFEEDMFEAIEFDGIEIREEGIFDILSSEVRRDHPELEQRLKEVYLNKWYCSRLGMLRGMTPSEARQTEEGTRLLWAMFQKIRQREKRAYLNGERLNLGLKDYLRRADM